MRWIFWISDPESEIDEEFYLNEHIIAHDDVNESDIFEFSVEFNEIAGS